MERHQGEAPVHRLTHELGEIDERVGEPVEAGDDDALGLPRPARRQGGAQPLAAVMAGACCLAVECNPDSIEFRLRTRYLDEKARTLDEAPALIARWSAAGEAKSVGLIGNAAEVFPELLARMQAGGPRPDIVGLSLPDRYLFGFGMDYKGYLRNCPAIYALPEQ